MRKVFTSIITCCVVLCLSFTSVFAANIELQSITVPYWWQIFYVNLTNEGLAGFVPYIASSKYANDYTDGGNTGIGYRFGLKADNAYLKGKGNWEYYIKGVPQKGEKIILNFYTIFSYGVSNNLTVSVEGYNPSTKKWTTITSKTLNYQTTSGTWIKTIGFGSNDDEIDEGYQKIVCVDYVYEMEEKYNRFRINMDYQIAGNVYSYFNFFGTSGMLDLDGGSINMAGGTTSSGGCVWTRDDITNISNDLGLAYETLDNINQNILQQTNYMVDWMQDPITMKPYLQSIAEDVDNINGMVVSINSYLDDVKFDVSAILNKMDGLTTSIVDGTEESNAVNDKVDGQNDALAGKVDEYDKLESQVNDQFNNAMDNIDLPSTDGIADFGTTALFVANQMQRVYTLHPSLQFMITISMVFGLVFVAIGVIGRRD